MQCNRGLVQVCESYNGKLLLINFIQNAQIRLVCSKQFNSFVVGYQTKTVGDSGFTLITPTFQKVDGSKTTLGDIQGQFSTFESIQVWDENGATLSEYFYMEEADSPTGKAGWFDENDVCADGVVIEAGNSVAFQSGGTTEVQFAGQVANSETVVVTGNTGFTAIGNNTPVDVKLGSINFEGIDTFDSIQIVDADGATEVEYFYMGELDSPSGTAGWFDENDQSADNVVIAPGSGVLFQAANGNAVTVTIPAAL